MITGKTQPGGISTTNLTVSHSPSRVEPEQLPPLPPNEELAPEKIDSSIDKWFSSAVLPRRLDILGSGREKFGALMGLNHRKELCLVAYLSDMLRPHVLA